MHAGMFPAKVFVSTDLPEKKGTHCKITRRTSQPEVLADDIIDQLQHSYRDPDTSFPDKIRLMNKNEVRSAEKSKLL